MKNSKMFSGLVVTALLTQSLVPGISALAQEVADAAAITADLKVMHTTDIHGYLMDYDYYEGTTGNYGFSRVASLIDAEREKAVRVAHPDVDNSLLFDNGDLIQGNPLGDYYSATGDGSITTGEVHPMYAALNTMEFDGATAGNHEFNFGLDYYLQIIEGFNGFHVNANVKHNDGTPLFGTDSEYQIIEEQVVTSEGDVEIVKVGVTGVVPPQILSWDHSHLHGKLVIEDQVQAVDRVTAEMKALGADVVVVIAHTGAGNGTGGENIENAGYDLMAVPNVDLVMTGHSHREIVTKDADTFLIQPTEWGKQLGVMDFKLVKTNDGWSVDMAKSQASVAKVTAATPNHPGVVATVADAHQATLDYVATPVAQSEIGIDSFFSQVSDNVSLELVQQAQTWYVEGLIADGNEDLAAYAHLPLLSAAAPFRAGYNGAYVDIDAGQLTMADISNLYIYPNTLTIVKVSGEDVKNWLEISARQFNQITPGSNNQSLLTTFPSYNFDVINGVTYQIDVSQPMRFDRNGLISTDNHRIINLEFEGQPIDMEQEFLVITNNYRAGGMDFRFAVGEGEKVVFADSMENRQVITEYAKQLGTITADNLSIDHNWSLAPIEHTIASMNAPTKANVQTQWDGNAHIQEVKAIDEKMSQYAINFAEEIDQSEFIDLQLLTFNDFHGQFDKDMTNKRAGVEYLTAYLKHQRDTHTGETLVLSAGDLIGASQPVTSLEHDEPTIEIFNGLVDLAVVGNHEFDRGTNELLRIMNGGSRENENGETVEFAGAQFPHLAANVVYKKDGKMLEGTTPYEILDVDGVPVGIIGVVTTETTKKVIPAGIADVDFLDERETINKYAEELSKKGVKSIIVLTHVPAQSRNGVLVDLNGKSDVYDIIHDGLHPEVDMIIGADNHAFANVIVERADGDDVLVTQAYSKGSAFSDAHVTISRATGDIVHQRADIMNTTHDKMNPDQDTMELVAKYYENVKSRLERVVAHAPETILRAINSKNGESELGRLIAEAQLAAVQENGKPEAQISFMNIGGVRDDIHAGDVTWNDIFTVQPFANDLTIQEITGDQLKRTLELQNIHDWVVAHQNDTSLPRPGMLQIAGFSYSWYPAYNEATSKWELKVSAMTLNTNGRTVEITDETILHSVSNIFVATGGDGFTPFAESDYEIVMNDLDAFEYYIDAHLNGELVAIDVDANPNAINLDQNFDGTFDEVEGDVEVDADGNPVETEGVMPELDSESVTPELNPDGTPVEDEGVMPELEADVIVPEAGGSTTTKPETEGTLPDTGMSQSEVMLGIGAIALASGSLVLVKKRKRA